MEKARKNLRDASILVLIFTAFSFIRSIVEILFADWNSYDLPAGATDNLVMISMIVMCVLTIIICVPQVYVGIRGLRVAENPVKTNGHIVWALILVVIAGLGFISSATSLFKAGFNLSGILEIADMGVDVFIFVLYVIYAKQVKAAA